MAVRWCGRNTRVGNSMIGRRGFITGLISLVAAPAIVRAGSLMPVKGEPLVLRTILPAASWCDLYGRGPMMEALDLPEMLWRPLFAEMIATVAAHCPLRGSRADAGSSRSRWPLS